MTFPKSHFARLSYVHPNAVHHKIVREARSTRGARMVPRRAAASLFKRIMDMKIDRVKVEDEFEVRPEDV